MNWYKLAQKIQQRIQERGLKPEDLFSFYSMQSLSPETFEENPDILYDFIESINSIKEYYLKFLIPRIVRELGHAIDRPDALSADEEDLIPDEEHYSYRDWCVDEELSQKEKNKSSTYNRYIEYMEDHDLMIPRRVSLSGGDEDVIVEIQNKTKLSKSDFTKIIDLFESLEWSADYGGPKWAEITRWAEKLYFTPSINIMPNIDLVLSKAQYLVYILDTIHSLHHNNALVLSELPMGEKYWLYDILEVIKHAQTPLVLSHLSNNPRLVKTIYNDRRILGGKIEAQEQALTDMLASMTEKGRWYFLKNLRYDPIIDVISRLDADLVKYLIFNHNGSKYKEYVPRIFGELVKRHGLENVLRSFPVYVDFKYHNLDSNPFPPEWNSAISEAYEKQGLQPNFLLF